MKYCFGVDIGGTTVKIGLFTTEGELLEKWEIKTRTENHGEAILPDVAESLQNKMQEKNIRKSEVDGIGIGIPAPVMEDGVVQKTANLGWGYKEVTREMKELTGLPVAAGNDANMAALGEMWLGGSHGAGGEIGHFCVNEEETETCGCGNTGCLEQYASATGISRLARRRLERDDSPSSLRGSEISAKAVFDALKEGDAVAKEIVEEFGSYLGHALAAIAVITDPSVIVIGGGVSKAGEILLEYVEKYFHEKAFFANEDTRFVLAQLGNDAGICGAAKLIL